MMRFKNIRTHTGEKTDLLLPSREETEIDASHLTVLPALIDPHVHFRTPGAEYKEDWKTGALSAIRGGVTTVFDMPNNIPPCLTKELFYAKKQIIDAQLKAVDIPLRYHLYFGADKGCLEEISNAPKEAIGLKIFMEINRGGLAVDTDDALDEAFARAAQAGLLIAIHAEDEAILAENKKKYKGATDPKIHGLMRPREAAIRATEKALALAAKYKNRLYILHMGTKEEVELVRQAKKQGISVFAETTTHQLFLSEDDYDKWKSLVQLNPPLRTREDQEALWAGIHDGTIEALGTDHAPHTLEEKQRPLGEALSGMPGVETMLPLMLDAVNRGLLTLEQLVALTRTNIERIFAIQPNPDIVLVDMNHTRIVDKRNLKSKCGWTPYQGWELKGWPFYTVCQGRIFKLS